MINAFRNVETIEKKTIFIYVRVFSQSTWSSFSRTITKNFSTKTKKRSLIWKNWKKTYHKNFINSFSHLIRKKRTNCHFIKNTITKLICSQMSHFSRKKFMNYQNKKRRSWNNTSIICSKKTSLKKARRIMQRRCS